MMLQVLYVVWRVFFRSRKETEEADYGEANPGCLPDSGKMVWVPSPNSTSSYPEVLHVHVHSV